VNARTVSMYMMLVQVRKRGRRMSSDIRRLPFNMLANDLAARAWVPRGARVRLLKALGLDIGDVSVGHGVYFKTAKIEIGDGSFINDGCYVENEEQISLGRRVHIGPGCRILTSSHHIGSYECRAGELFARPVTIGDGVWLGANVLVMPGVTIGQSIVVAAGSVVTSSIAEAGVYGGLPARCMRRFDSTPEQRDQA
jgi:maltose O-acetyltransferase